MVLVGILYQDRLFGLLAPAALPTITATLTSIPPSQTLTLIDTEAPTLTPTLRATATLKATLTLTATFTAVPPTQGPGLETPFGSPLTFVVHRVKDGESYNIIAADYQTSIEVIKAMNYIKPGTGLWAGSVLVLVPGATDPKGLPQVTAVLLATRMRVADLAIDYKMDPALLRQYNALGAGEWLEANRWVVVSFIP